MMRPATDLTLDEVLAEVRFDADAGEFFWARNRPAIGRGCRARVEGQTASRKAAGGYRGVTINGAAVLCHRLAWLFVHGQWPQGDIDHINGNRGDNRPENLRDVPRKVNMQNLRRSHRDCASQLLGAYFDKRRGRWTSQIASSGKNTFLGYFDSADEAHEAYVKAKRVLHSDGCRI